MGWKPQAYGGQGSGGGSAWGHKAGARGHKVTWGHSWDSWGSRGIGGTGLRLMVLRAHRCTAPCVTYTRLTPTAQADVASMARASIS